MTTSDWHVPRLCLATIAITWLGLMGAALEVKWGAAPPAGDALRLAWLYVQMMLAGMWLVVWPAMARPGHSRRPLGGLPAEAAAIIVGAIPAVGVAAFLAEVTLAMALAMVSLQAALALLAAGAVSWRQAPRGAWANLPAALLATAALAGPVAGYLWWECCPEAPQGWLAVIPGLAVIRSARHAATAGAYGAAFWVLCGGYAVVGLSLWRAARRMGRQTKAPGNDMPGAVNSD